MNQREVSNYLPLELQTGQTWSNPINASQKRPGFRKVFFIGAIGTGMSLSFAHNITSFTLLTDIYGSVQTDQPDFRPLPYTDTTNINKQISVTIDTTNINIVVGAGSPNVLSGVLTLEYLRN